MRIEIRSCFPSGLSPRPEENGARLIDVRDIPFDSGGQGKIYEVTHLDGRSVSGLLLKSFEQRVPDNVKEIIAAVRDNKDNHGISQCVALRALPLFAFEGTANSIRFDGYLLRKVGGKSFDKIVEQDLNSYIKLPLRDRLELCAQFVEGMSTLYALTIVHADINYQNIIIDLKQNKLAIIDLDGGAVARTGSTPIVLGKAEPGWLDPQILGQLAATTKQQTVNVSITADLWAIACGVHHLLFGLAPFFFIATQPEIEQYLQRYRWPQLSGLSAIKTINRNAFKYFEKAYADVPALHKYLQISFQEGYRDPGRRIGAYQWMQVIKAELMALAPASRADKERELQEFIGLALIDGVLTNEERKFILELSQRLGVPSQDAERLIDEEVRKRPAKRLRAFSPSPTPSPRGSATQPVVYPARQPTAPLPQRAPASPQSQTSRRTQLWQGTAAMILACSAVIGAIVISTNQQNVNAPTNEGTQSVSNREAAVLVVAIPTPANVFDSRTDEWWGQTPLHVIKPVGHYSLIVRKQGYRPRPLSFDVASGQDNSDTVTLDPLPMSIIVGSQPPGSHVVIDGKQVGTTPYRGSILSPGAHQIEVLGSGRVKSKTFEFAPGGEERFNAVLSTQSVLPVQPVPPRPPMRPPQVTTRGTLSVYGAAGAEFLLNGTRQCCIPKKLSLAPGQYTVEDSARNWGVTVVVVPDQERPITVP